MNSSLSDKNISIEKKKYRKDSLSFWLLILGLLLNIFYFFTLYRNNDNFYYTYKMGLSVLYNLIFMLLVFLSAEEVKNYHSGFGILSIIIGALQLGRIFIYPKQAFEAGVLQLASHNAIIVYLILSALCLIAGGIVSIYRSTILKNFIKNQDKVMDK